MSAAAAVDRIRGLLAGVLPVELVDASVVISHPGAQEEYALGLSLFVLQIREDAAWRSHPGATGHTLLEADLLISAHAPPERGFEAVRLLEVACEVLRANPELGALSARVSAEVLLRPLALDEMASLWQAMGAHMHPSVLCVVRVAVDSSAALSGRDDL
jgi:hypothetical protein